MRIGSMIAVALTVASCGGSPQQRAANGGQETAEAYQQRILALPESQRLAVFLRAIRDSGQDCQDVRSAVGAGPHQGHPVWSVTCRGGSHWTVMLTDGGGAQVFNADQIGRAADQRAGNAVEH